MMSMHSHFNATQEHYLHGHQNCTLGNAFETKSQPSQFTFKYKLLLLIYSNTIVHIIFNKVNHIITIVSLIAKSKFWAQIAPISLRWQICKEGQN